MSNPFENFQQGLMTGAQLGQGAYRQGQRRELASAYQSGGMTGAATAAFGQGDFESGMQFQQRGRQQSVGTALATGDFDAATTAADGDVQLLGQIRQWKESASEAEIAAASRRAESFAQIGIQLLDVKDPVQRRQQALAIAQREGIPPDQIPEVLTDDMLTGWYRSNMSAAELLAERKDARDATRPIISNGMVLLPPGAQLPQGIGGQQQALGSTLPPGWTPQPRPNQPSAASASVGGERSQPVSVNFRSSQEAQSTIQSIVPGVRVTSGRRSQADNRRVGGSPGSFHLQDRARDLVPPPGMSMAQLEAKMRQAGFRALNEGDHIHVSW